MIVPVETALTAPYWAAARRGDVLLQRCRCGNVWHPPAPVCPRCRGTDWVWRPATGSAALVSWTRVTHAVHPEVAAAVPYLVGLVRLEEGPLFVCGLEAAADELLVDGAAITIGPGSAAGGGALPMGRLAAPAARGAAGPARPG